MTHRSLDSMVQQLIQWNTAYAYHHPLVSDMEYDELWFQVRQLDPENPALFYTSRQPESSNYTFTHSLGTSIPLVTVYLGSDSARQPIQNRSTPTSWWHANTSPDGVAHHFHSATGQRYGVPPCVIHAPSFAP